MNYGWVALVASIRLSIELKAVQVNKLIILLLVIGKRTLQIQSPSKPVNQKPP